MPLTPAEVRETTFSTTRMRSGYEMDEVDEFLDIVEADIAQYADELQRSRDGEAVLRAQCDQLQSRLVLAETRLAEAQASLASARAPIPAVVPAPVIAPDVLKDPEGLSIIELAQSTADQIIRHAESQAAAIRASVRATLNDQLGLLGN